MVLEVYSDPCTVNCHKVLAGLDLMGVPFKHVYVNWFTGEHRKGRSLELNPFATIPYAVDDDGPCITESNAILAYAADKYGSHPAYPQDLQQRAQVNRWLLWETSALFPCAYVLLLENCIKPKHGMEQDLKALKMETEKFNKFAKILDDHLAKSKWLVGDNVTIADIAVAAPLHMWAKAKMPLHDYPNFKRWMAEGVEQLPSWKKTQAPVEERLGPNVWPESDDAARASSNGQKNGTNGGPKSVRATLNYTKNLEPDRLTELYYFEPEEPVDVHDPADDPPEVELHDGWPRARGFSIDEHGFALADYQTAFAAWEDEEVTRRDFYPEVVEFLKSELGAKRVLVFDHTIRTMKNQAKKVTQETDTTQRAPIMLVHCDYTAESGPTRVKQLLGDEAEDLLSRRVAFINVWKPLNVVEERPLAMCDATTTQKDDFFKLHLHYRDRKGENYVMKWSPRQKWWYFPQMGPEKVILLKTYDSETDGRARFVGHSAFEDPTSRKDAPMRESCEIRTICFF